MLRSIFQWIGFGKFGKSKIMTEPSIIRESIIRKVKDLSEEKLEVVESFLNNISQKKDLSEVEMIYKKAVERYHETLQRLAQ